MKFKMAMMAVSVLKDGKLRKKVAKVIAIILAPFSLVMVVCISSASAASEHNNAVVETVFDQKEIPESIPEPYDSQIKGMQDNFLELDTVIANVQEKVRRGALDPMFVKSLFFSVFFEEGSLLPREQLQEYVDCFVNYEEVVLENEEAAGEEEVETEIIAVVIEDTDKVIDNVSIIIGKEISDNQIKNFDQIYHMVNLGANASTSGDGNSMKELLKDVIENSENSPYVGGEPGSPFMDDWRNKITSEFGRRDNITLPDGTVMDSVHTGMDLGSGTPLGTAITAVQDGKVVYVRNHKVGLGLHLAIDHGGGVLTVYGHTSRILVKEGDTVKKGQKIAEVGSTGFSTGPHLHLEYWLHGEVLDPRKYLE